MFRGTLSHAFILAKSLERAPRLLGLKSAYVLKRAYEKVVHFKQSRV